MEKSSVIKDHHVKPSKAPLIISVSVIVILLGCYFIVPGCKDTLHDTYDILMSDDEERVKNWVAQFGIMGPIVIVVSMVVQMFLLVIPNILLMMIAILSYGPVWGSVISLIGVFTASSFGYMIGRSLSPITLQKFVSVKNQQKIAEFINHYGVGAIMITRLSSFSNDALSFVAGILNMGYKKYILSTLAGITPLIVVLALYGRNGNIEKALIWIGATTVILFILYIVIDKRRRKKRQSPVRIERETTEQVPKSRHP